MFELSVHIRDSNIILCNEWGWIKYSPDGARELINDINNAIDVIENPVPISSLVKKKKAKKKKKN